MPLDILKGGDKAIYHLTEEAIHILEDIPATLRALVNMITRSIDTVKYIGNAIIDSFNRDVIYGDAESRAHRFTYAAGSIFGFKGLGNAGKVGAQAAL